MSDGRELVIAIDPGVHGCGVAFLVNGQLKHARYIRPEDIGGVAGAWWLGVTEVSFILEKPQVYKTRLLKGDPNDLIDVAVAGGELLGRMFMFATTMSGVPVSRVIIEKIVPAVWKKQLPKEVVVERVKPKLTPQELAVVVKPKPISLFHNVWDAVGIGLWGVKRFVP
jgi:hypothetical protein